MYRIRIRTLWNPDLDLGPDPKSTFPDNQLKILIQAQFSTHPPHYGMAPELTCVYSLHIPLTMAWPLS
jgi:hypothetical protein